MDDDSTGDNMKSLKYILAILTVAIGFLFICPVEVHAAGNDVVMLSDGEYFSPSYYVANNPDVTDAFGTDPEILAQHYLINGRYEGRLPISIETAKNYIILMTNQLRAENGLPALVEDPALDNIADVRASEEVSASRMDHYRQDGTSFRTAYTENGNCITSCGGENLARYGTLQQVIDLWMDSGSHRQNTLYADYTKIGVGIAQKTSTDGLREATQYCYSQEFAK